MSKNNGLKFEQEFGRWLNKHHEFVIKLPDTRSLRLKSKIISRASGKNFQELTGTRVPGDFWSVNEGTSYLWECKSTQQKSFPLQNIKPHQVNALLSHYLAGGESYVIIGWSEGILTMIPIDKFLSLTAEVVADGRHSIPKIMCEIAATKTLYRRTPKDLPEGETKARYE